MLNNKNCKDCYYSNVCAMDEVCAEFAPITEEGIDAEVDELIECRRAEFIAEWNEYISEYQD